MGGFQNFCLRWNNHSSNFVGNLETILASEDYSDVTVCCQGEVWHLHQLVLSASSSHFAQLLRLIPPGQSPILILDGPSAGDIRALIHFIYHGEVNVDHDSLPSLLRTAASFRIKGLADVSNLTGELNSECETQDQLDAFLAVDPEAFDASPLNLSCNKGPPDDSKFERKKKNFKRVNDFSEAEENAAEIMSSLASEVVFQPPKRIRTLERVSGNGKIALVSPNGCNNAILTPIVTAPKLIHSTASTVQSHLTNPAKEASKPEGVTVTTVPKEGSSYINISPNVSLPILKMALSPYIAYHSSSPQSQGSSEASDIKAVRDVQQIANITDIIQIPAVHAGQLNSLHAQASSVCGVLQRQSNGIQLNHGNGVQLAVASISPAKIYSQEEMPQTECILKKGGVDYVVENPPSSNINGEEKYVEKTFTHKKFSACAIPQSAKTYRIVKGVYSTTQPVNQVDPCKIEENAEIMASIEVSSGQVIQISEYPIPAKQSSVQTSKQSPTSVVYSGSAELQFCEAPVISSSSSTSEESDPQNTCEQSQYVLGSGESLSLMATPAANAAGETAGSAPNTQRVTVNMRTFKEEWRRQLLVDYDPNTNMSICMLCFTTFKSYDGPRKNTYVKHAKRFHPSLDDYSEEERASIISMYEKYHKYDIDMQKEINKSFRTTSGSSATLKRIRAAELGTHMLHSSSGETMQSDSECKTPESESEVASVEVTTAGVRREGQKRGRTESAEKLCPDHDIPNNNNNSKKRNENDLKVDVNAVTNY